MREDQYLKQCKYKYGIKLYDYLNKQKVEPYEYMHTLLKYSDFDYLYKLIGGTKIFTPAEMVNFKEVINEPDSWARYLMRSPSSNRNFLRKYNQQLKDILISKIKPIKKKTLYQKNLERLEKIFKFGETGKDIITFFYLLATDKAVEDCFDNLNFLNFTDPIKNLRSMSNFFNISAKELRDLFSKDSVLMKAGILVNSRRENSKQLSESITAYLSNFSSNTLESQYVKKIKTKESVRLRDHNVDSGHTETLINLLTGDRSCNILLYGHPGTGKTEFAKSLAQATGQDIYFVNQGDNSGEESLRFRKQAIIAANNIIQDKQAILVVDECDKILNIYEGFWMIEAEKNNDRKAWVNDLLETNSLKIIWIANNIDGMDESTKRRFSYSLEFSPLTFKQRKKVWENQVKRQKATFLLEEDINFFAKTMQVNSGGITLALQDVKAMKKLKTKKGKIEALKRILAQHEKLTIKSENSKLVKRTNHYNLEVINSDYPLRRVMEQTEKFLSDKDKFQQHEIHNLSYLLQGPPGTGKTEFVKHIAETLDRELIIKRASDIRSKWYGESVKNIAASFKEAEEKGGILFFDEADSFFESRETANQWHAEETNEFLTQMENFKGILICATNFTQKLDQASMRRFNYKIKFDYLDNKGKVLLFKEYFENICQGEMNEEEIHQLKGLTPGDFKVVYQKNVFKEKVPFHELIEDLRMEVAYKPGVNQKKLGLTN